ncbi:MAG: hypothetical protein JXD23_10000 [Spirochaetales bacterium]|nr:hypothetical protein [Spirochaetales bacterium]
MDSIILACAVAIGILVYVKVKTHLFVYIRYAPIAAIIPLTIHWIARDSSFTWIIFLAPIFIYCLSNIFLSEYKIASFILIVSAVIQAIVLIYYLYFDFSKWKGLMELFILSGLSILLLVMFITFLLIKIISKIIVSRKGAEKTEV